MSKCIGCGIELQNEDINRLGYVPLAIMIEKGGNVYCKRCHNLRHYNKENKYEDLKHLNQSLFVKIKHLFKKDVLVILLIDVLDIYGGFIPNLDQYIGRNPVAIFLNKIDLLPKGIKITPFIDRIKDIAKSHHLNIISVKPISAIKMNKKEVSEQIFWILNKKKNYPEDVYVIGCTSVGKSTFINHLLGNDEITTSERHQTTLDLIKIPLGLDSYKRFHFLIDTPGFVHFGNLGTYLSYESTRHLIPKSFIRVRTYQLNKAQTIFLGGLARIDFLEGNEISASFFVSNDLYLHRTKTEQASTLYNKQLGQLFIPPITDDEKAWVKETTSYDFDIEVAHENDLFISGIGFIHFGGTNIKLKVTVPKQVLVKLEPSILSR